MVVIEMLVRRLREVVCGCCFDEEVPLFEATCAEKPELLKETAIGMYHCPDCGAMLLAGLPHPPLCKRCLEPPASR